MPTKEFTPLFTESLPHPLIQFKQDVAQALVDTGQYQAEIGEDLLSPIIACIISELIDRHSLGPATHHTTADSLISSGLLAVSAAVHLQKPITARIKLNYSLINHPRLKKLALVESSLTTHTQAGFIAKMALRSFDIPALARQSVDNLPQLIADILNRDLAPFGFPGQINQVGIQLNQHQVALDLNSGI